MFKYLNYCHKLYKKKELFYHFQNKDKFQNFPKKMSEKEINGKHSHYMSFNYIDMRFVP